MEMYLNVHNFFMALAANVFKVFIKKIPYPLLIIFFVFPVYAQNISLISDKALLTYKDGKENDITVSITKAALDRAKLAYEYEIFPWARLYRTALNTENVIIPLLAKTSEREKLFKWVGRTIYLGFYFYKLKKRKDVIINSLEDAKKYRIGVMRDDVRHQYFIKHGFNKNLHVVVDDVQNIRLLLAERIELYPSSDLEIRLQCENKIIKNCYDFVPCYEIKELSSWIYAAYSKKTSDEIVERTKDAFDLIKTDGTYHKLIDNN